MTDPLLYVGILVGACVGVVVSVLLVMWGEDENEND